MIKKLSILLVRLEHTVTTEPRNYSGTLLYGNLGTLLYGYIGTLLYG